MIAELAVERVIIVPDSHDQQEVIDGIRLIKALGVKVSVVPGCSRWSGPPPSTTTSTASRCSECGSTGCPSHPKLSSGPWTSAGRCSGSWSCSR